MFWAIHPNPKGHGLSRHEFVNNVKLFVIAKTASSAVYNINYHIVWCPKYRKKILVGNLKKFPDLRRKMWKGKRGVHLTMLELRDMFLHKPLKDISMNRKNTRRFICTSTAVFSLCFQIIKRIFVSQ